MAISDQTTVLSNLSLTGNLAASTISSVGTGTSSFGTVVASFVSTTGAPTSSFGTVSTGILTSSATVTASAVSTTGATTSSFGTVTASFVSTTAATTNSFGTIGATSGISLGGGTLITNAFAVGVAVAAVVCQATSSTSTLISGVLSLTTSHFLTIHPPSGSGISSGLVYNIQPGSAASTAVLTLSNASTVAATIAAVTWRLSGIRYSGV